MMGDVIKFAKERGYYGAEYSGKWRGCDVYTPTFENNDCAVGLPLVILKTVAGIRMATADESFAYLDYINGKA